MALVQFDSFFLLPSEYFSQYRLVQTHCMTWISHHITRLWSMACEHCTGEISHNFVYFEGQSQMYGLFKWSSSKIWSLILKRQFERKMFCKGYQSCLLMLLGWYIWYHFAIYLLSCRAFCTVSEDPLCVWRPALCLSWMEDLMSLQPEWSWAVRGGSPARRRDGHHHHYPHPPAQLLHLALLHLRRGKLLPPSVCL